MGVMSSCSSGSMDPMQDDTDPASVEIYEELVDAFVGETSQLHTFVRDASGATLERVVVWSTADPGVAAVSAAGEITATGVGETIITAAVGTVQATIAVRVVEAPRLTQPIEGVSGQDFFLHRYVAHIVNGSVVDFDCGRKATLNDGRGTDYAILDFEAMRRGVAVLAAAEGVVASAHGGEFDHQVSNFDIDLAAIPNEVVVDHGEGVRTVYSGLRRDVLVTQGQHVNVGDTLGYVGSSRTSVDYEIIPHLHFEVWLNDRLVDPYQGSCGSAVSLWADQPTYEGEYRLLRARVSDQPQWGTLHLISDPPSLADTIRAGGEFIVWVTEFNAQPEVESELRVARPDGEVLNVISSFHTREPPGLSWLGGEVVPVLQDVAGTWTFQYWYDDELKSSIDFELVLDDG